MKVKVRFVLTSHETSHETITAVVGLTPTKTWHKGDVIKRPHAILHHKENGWEIDTPYVETLNLAEAARPLLTTLVERADQIQRAIREFKLSAEFSFYVDHFAGESYPIINFEAGMIRQIETLGASLDIDTIAFPSEESSESSAN